MAGPGTYFTEISPTKLMNDAKWSITPTDAGIKLGAVESLASGESRWHFTNWSGHCKLEVDFKPSSEKSFCIEWFNKNEFKHFPLNDIMVRY